MLLILFIPMALEMNNNIFNYYSIQVYNYS